MTVEELREKVNEKTDISKLKSLSTKTIDEELNDVLDEIGDDDDANDKIITKLANRLKRIDGNLHKNVSSEIKKAKEEAERKKKEEEDERKRAEQHKDDDEDKYQKLLDKIESLEKANIERDKKAARNATIESVKAGLKAKFEKAGLKVNGFFEKTALSRLEIPEENADVASLVAKAEVLYNEDIKAAGYVQDTKPHNGGGGSGNSDAVDEHEFDDIAAAVALRRPKTAE